MDDFLDVILLDRVETDNAPGVRLVGLEVFCAFQVHNAYRVVVRLTRFVRRGLFVWVCVQGNNRREMNCLLTFVLIEAGECEASFLDGCFVLLMWSSSFAKLDSRICCEKKFV